VTGFWVAAALFCAVAVGFLLLPLWRQRRHNGRWSWLGIAAAFGTVPLALGLYLHVSDWNPDAAEQASEGAQLVARLAERMRQNPDDLEGWRLLGNSYMALGQYTQARVAFSEAWRRTSTPDNALKVAFGEAQVFTDQSALTGEAGRLFEEVLNSEPYNAKALWYGGLAAARLGREDVARERWTRLLELELPDEVRQVFEAQLAMLAPEQDGGVGASGGGRRAAPDAEGAAQGPTIALDVRLGNGLSVEQLGGQAALFIFARAPGERAPVAVLREPASAVPGKFTLSDANSMIPGRSLGDYEELTLVARLSASGQPAEQPGDWYAQSTVMPGESGPIELVIDQVVR
jgi:cytochrome c-type biogenesis protein CcmH